MENTDVIIKAAKMHIDCCMEDLWNYFWHLKGAIKTCETPGEAISAAGIIKGEKVFDAKVEDIPYLVSFDSTFHMYLENNDFEKFVDKFIKSGSISVRKYVKRSLTEEEQEKAGIEYKDGCENILRPFDELSEDSKGRYVEKVLSILDISYGSDKKIR